MVDNIAPVPSGNTKKVSPAESSVSDNNAAVNPKNPSAVSVTIAGCGGAGINLSRPHFNDKQGPQKVLYFDTSMTNSRHGELVNVVTNGSGSGSNRAENASDIERGITSMSDADIGLGDVAIVIFSLGGGSGSVLGPLLLREYSRRGARVIGVVVSDTSSSVSAKNCLNTLKTLTAVSKNNNLYLPLIVLSNDSTSNPRQIVNAASQHLIQDLIDLLTKNVYEVDRNDRLNWINPTKVVNAQHGLKILSLLSDNTPTDSKVVLGIDSKEMVDSLIILQNETGDTDPELFLPPSRLKKMGFYVEPHRFIVGKVSSDIKSIDSVIDFVEKMDNISNSQKHSHVDRLNVSGNDDLIL